MELHRKIFLGLTFTRNAADAMREKLVPVLDDMASRVTLSTIHSFCHYLLRCEGVTFNVLSGKDQIIFLRNVMKKLKSQGFIHRYGFTGNKPGQKQSDIRG